MTTKTRLKLRDFARAHRLTPEQRDRLGATLEHASARQAEVILRESSRLLSGQRVYASARPPEQPEQPTLVKPARLASPVSAGLVDANGRPISTGG